MDLPTDTNHPDSPTPPHGHAHPTNQSPYMHPNNDNPLPTNPSKITSNKPYPPLFEHTPTDQAKSMQDHNSQKHLATKQINHQMANNNIHVSHNQLSSTSIKTPTL